ncbi:MAG: ABC transporter substrate-binding protein, partial [Acidimicrobiaceae bacterium]|nr:ABC transporter substrate-binding protein [Acidimicrobiaceae bacterium]
MIGKHKVGAILSDRWGKAVIFSMAAATVLAACGGSAASSSTTTSPAPQKTTSASGSPVVFHVLLSETGAGAFLGSRGATSLKAQAAYINTNGGINGHPIQLDIEDNQSSPSVNVSLATTWIAQGVHFILNGSLAGIDAPVDALATPNGP